MALKLNNKPAVRYNPSLKVKKLGPYGARPARQPIGPYKGARPGIGKKKPPTFEQQMGPRPIGT